MTVDQEARDMAAQANAAVKAHEDVCAVRWAAAIQSMREVKTMLWVGFGGVFTSLIGLVGWLANKAF